MLDLFTLDCVLGQKFQMLALMMTRLVGHGYMTRLTNESMLLVDLSNIEAVQGLHLLPTTQASKKRQHNFSSAYYGSAFFVEALIDLLQLKVLLATMDQASSPEAIYSPLSRSNKEIRLLSLLHSFDPSSDVDTSPLHAALTAVPLLESSTPSFKALSYVWGPPSAAPAHYLHLNGQKFPIRPNLHECLVHLRRQHDGVPIWIDAICINQSDVPERNSQVLLMGDIYRSAASVVSWIGSDQILVKGLRKVTEISATWLQHKSQFKSLALDDLMTGSSSEVQDWVQETSESFWQDHNQLLGLVSLFGSEYWKRVWIVQEVMLSRASSHVYLCGDEMAYARDLDALCECIFMIFGHKVNKPDSISWEVWALVLARILPEIQTKLGFWAVQRGFATPTLLYVLEISKSRLSTDARDAVYGLLNVIPDHGIVPDYAKPVAQVYVDWAVKTMEYSGNMNLLSYAFAGAMTSAHVDLDLPSWVPDLHNHKGFKEVIWHKQARQDPPDGFLVEVVDGRILKAKGRIVDKVSKVTQFLSCLVDGEKWAASWKEDMVGFCFMYLKEQRDAQRLYPTGIPALQALVQMVLGSTFDTLELDESSEQFHELTCQFIAFLMGTFCATIGAGRPYQEAYAVAASVLGFTVTEGAFGQDYQAAVFPGIDVEERYGWDSLIYVTSELVSKHMDRMCYTVTDWFKFGPIIIETAEGYLGLKNHTLANVMVGDCVVAIKDCKELLHMRQSPEGFRILGNLNVLAFDDAGDHSTAQDLGRKYEHMMIL